jgi:hypothetical protein
VLVHVAGLPLAIFVLTRSLAAAVDWLRRRLSRPGADAPVRAAAPASTAAIAATPTTTPAAAAKRPAASPRRTPRRPVAPRSEFGLRKPAGAGAGRGTGR